MDAAGWLREQVEASVQAQRHVRQRIATLVAGAAEHGLRAGKGTTDVVRATLDGARSALRTEGPTGREALFRQVVEGLADGLGTAAHAAELTLREAHGDLARFTREDLTVLAHGLEEVGRQFGGLVADAAADGAVLAAEEASRVRSHAESTWKTVAPRIAAVAAAAAAAPATAASGAAQVTGAAARGAASALFTELGRQLQALGVAIGEPRPKG